MCRRRRVSGGAGAWSGGSYSGPGAMGRRAVGTPTQVYSHDSTRMKRPLLAALFVLGAACHSPAGPATLGPLKIVAQDGALHLENASDEPVFYFVYERQSAALINWAPCVSRSCPSLEPRAQASVPYSTIGGYAPGRTEAIVWWSRRAWARRRAGSRGRGRHRRSSVLSPRVVRSRALGTAGR